MSAYSLEVITRREGFKLKKDTGTKTNVCQMALQESRLETRRRILGISVRFWDSLLAGIVSGGKSEVVIKFKKAYGRCALGA